MIIDLHTHIFPDKIAATAIDKLSHASGSLPFSDGTADGLRRSMEEAGIDCSVILPVATHPAQTEKINDFAARLNERYEKQGLLSLGGIHPDSGNYRAELARLQSLGLKGIKIHPVYQDTNLDDIRYLRILERAAELGLVIVTHAGLDIGFPGVVRCSPQMAKHLQRELGNIPLILAHMGGWRNWDDVLGLLTDTSFFLDTAFSFGSIRPRPDMPQSPESLKLLDDRQFLQFLESFGAGRILFGTDSPWSSQKESLQWIRNLPISEAEKQKILGENAAELLRISI